MQYANTDELIDPVATIVPGSVTAAAGDGGAAEDAPDEPEPPTPAGPPPAATPALLRELARAQGRVFRRMAVRREVGFGALVDLAREVDPRLDVAATDRGTLVPGPMVRLVTVADYEGPRGRADVRYAAWATELTDRGPRAYKTPFAEGSPRDPALAAGPLTSLACVVARADAAMARSAAARLAAWKGETKRLPAGPAAARDADRCVPVGLVAVPNPAAAEKALFGRVTAEGTPARGLQPAAAALFWRWAVVGGPVYSPVDGTIEAVAPVARMGQECWRLTIRPDAGGPPAELLVSAGFRPVRGRADPGDRVAMGDWLGADPLPDDLRPVAARGDLNTDRLRARVRGWLTHAGLRPVAGYTHLPAGLFDGRDLPDGAARELGAWLLPPGSESFTVTEAPDVAGYAFPALDPITPTRGLPGPTIRAFRAAPGRVTVDGHLDLPLPPAD